MSGAWVREGVGAARRPEQRRPRRLHGAEGCASCRIYNTMVAPESMALVVRQRGGPNLIVHTLTNTHYAELTPLCSRGIPGSLVNRACEEAVTIMGRFALGRGQTDVDGCLDLSTSFSS